MPKLFIAGDSTAATKLHKKRPETGWGEHLSSFITPNLEVRNFAQNGRSTKSFIDDGLLDHIEREIGEFDYLLIQFGHNDEKIEDQSRYTNPNTTYKENLLKFVLVARKNQAIPILVTPISRRRFIDKQTIDPLAVGHYPKAMQEFARDQKIELIDMFSITQKLYEDLGAEQSKKLFLHLEPNEHENYPEGIKDDTHLSPYGAKIIASIIAVELKKII
ncbi:MAG: rhamnogalacturonan acetylesterase [Tenericutes bacterium]|nr:rhamnogalacturonan acetylesterase [Mycoplasmatota bacterium]